MVDGLSSRQRLTKKGASDIIIIIISIVSLDVSGQVGLSGTYTDSKGSHKHRHRDVDGRRGGVEFLCQHRQRGQVDAASQRPKEACSGDDCQDELSSPRTKFRVRFRWFAAVAGGRFPWATAASGRALYQRLGIIAGDVCFRAGYTVVTFGRRGGESVEKLFRGRRWRERY